MSLHWRFISFFGLDHGSGLYHQYKGDGGDKQDGIVAKNDLC